MKRSILAISLFAASHLPGARAQETLFEAITTEMARFTCLTAEGHITAEKGIEDMRKILHGKGYSHEHIQNVTSDRDMLHKGVFQSISAGGGCKAIVDDYLRTTGNNPRR